MDQHDNPSLQAILFSDESYWDEHTQQCMCCDQLYQWQTGHGCCRQTFLFLIHYQYTVRLGEKNRGSSKLFWGMFLRFPVLNHYQSLLRINLFSNTNYIVFFCHSSTCKILFYTVGVREKPWVKHKNNINVG